jgi:hypothetical protein
MKTPIFKNAQTQELFDKQGFVTIPFLKAEQINQLNNLFDELHPTLPENGFFSGSYSSDLEYKQKASEAIVRIFEASNQLHFTNYTPFGASFLVKMSSENSDLEVHQDWTIVDETRYYALNCWVPLCDINLDNGPLMVLPGSHFDKYPSLRSPTMEFFFKYKEQELIKHLIPLTVKAGEAIVLSQSLVHYSPPNLSGNIRKAITSGIKSKGAPMLFHYTKSRKESLFEIEQYAMSESFLLEFENFMDDILKKPKGQFSTSFTHEQYFPEEEEMKQFVKKLRTEAGFPYPEKTKSFWQKITSKLGLQHVG